MNKIYRYIGNTCIIYLIGLFFISNCNSDLASPKKKYVVDIDKEIHHEGIGKYRRSGGNHTKHGESIDVAE